jgi:hypothetical protein
MYRTSLIHIHVFQESASPCVSYVPNYTLSHSQKTLMFSDIAYLYHVISMDIYLDCSACVLGVISIFSVKQHNILIEHSGLCL